MTDHLIPSVEDAANDYADSEVMRDIWAAFCGCRDRCHECASCCSAAGVVEACSVALDNALAQTSDRRRAADDELRRSVAW